MAVTPERQKQIDAENFKVGLSILGRTMAPIIIETFEKVSAATGQQISLLYLIMRYEPGSDLDNVKSCVIEMRDMLSQKLIPLQNDPGKAQSSTNDLEQAFPLLKELVIKYSETWNVTPYDLFITIRLKKTGTGADALNLDVKTGNHITPFRTETIL
jgi:hypothetical protein